MKVGVVQFPGTNCDDETVAAVVAVGGEAVRVWHEDRALPAGTDAVILPGGFSYGDYLRTGAIARFAPVMDAVASFAERGGVVVGICNGFQILCEAGLLPGALLPNVGLKFECRWVAVRVEAQRPAFTSAFKVGETINLPIAHFEGRFTCDEKTLAEIERDRRVLLRYRENPNGSMNNIAGLVNARGNVFGLMPHPERDMETWMSGGPAVSGTAGGSVAVIGTAVGRPAVGRPAGGSVAGRRFFESLVGRAL
jgi:phosphoribosylformylglycinamidine synthase